MLNYQFFPKTKQMPEHLLQVIQVFERVYKTINSDYNNLHSNEVLSIITKPLQDLYFDVEQKGHKIEVPVLFGRNGVVAKSFEADAYHQETKTVIEVRGCYWHRHEGCKDATTPSTNTEFWQKKFAENVARDQSTEQKLKGLGWNVIVVWQCEVEKNLFQANLTNKIISGDINA